jgi:hypothetical protein
VKKTILICGILVIAFLALGGVWLYGQQAPQPRAAATHTISSASALPNLLPVNSSTSITITAQITDPSLIANSVNLLQLGAPGTQPSIIGQLQSTATNTYTIGIPLSRTTPGQIQFQVSAAFTGALRRVLSSVIPVLFLATPSTTFTVDTRSLSSGGPLSFNNFGNAYLAGGLLPSNGATINVTSIPLPPPPLSNYIEAVELAGATTISLTSITVSGIGCTEATYSDVFGGNVTYNGVAVYCPYGATLYKFYLTYQSNDSNISQDMSAFQQLLNSATF